MALAERVATRWDEGNEHFPPATWQVSKLDAGTGARHVIAGMLEMDSNFWFSAASTPGSLQQRVHEILTRHHGDECIAVASIEPLTRVYRRTLELLLA